MPNLCIKLGDCWYHANGVSVTGAGFAEDRLQKRAALINYFNQVRNLRDFAEKVKGLNGFFAVVIQRDNECYAAVDRVRSIPLFYALHEDRFFLSDDPEWIQNQIGGQVIDSVALTEFLLTGYVVGPHTLDPRIRQLQAGEALVVTATDGKTSYQTGRYYRFLTGRGEMHDWPERELLNRLNEVTLVAIRRLVTFADGRPIVIPLSGGLDSRLIAMSLQSLGYKNVIAFSYGVRGNWESKVSQEVAHRLGIPWYFVEYSPDLWKRWYWSEECGLYRRYSSRLVSLAHLQDWPAIKELLSKGVIPEESVIVPGHAGDFVAGSHIPLELQNQQGSNVQDVMQAIFRHHYILMPLKVACEYAKVDLQDIQGKISGRLRLCFEFATEGTLTTPEAVSLYECWDWQERQAKYIVNSVRVYDFYGLEWWLPWWDAEFIEFWECVPLKLRIGCKMYRDYVNGIQARWKIKSKKSFIAQAKKLIGRADKTGLLKKVYAALLKHQIRSPAWRILALNGAFDLSSERYMSILGAAALAQLGLPMRSES